MKRCPTCGRQAAPSAQFCPGCGASFPARNQPNPIAQGIGCLIGTVALLFLSPGIAVNWLLGRFERDIRSVIGASIADWPTWLMSGALWALLISLVVRRFRGSFPQLNGGPGQTPQIPNRGPGPGGPSGHASAGLSQHFEELELDPGASLEEIKQAYRDLLQVWHPDRYSHSQRLHQRAEERTKRINAAYDALSRAAIGQ